MTIFITTIISFCRIISIIFMFSGLFIGTFCTLFILREFSSQRFLRTPLNILIISIFLIDCLRALICAPLESFVLIQTWQMTIGQCQRRRPSTIEFNEFMINFCRLTMIIRSCFSVTQPFAFVAIGYERLRTVVTSRGHLKINVFYQNQWTENIRMKKIFLWIFLTFILGVLVGIYQGIFYSMSNTCFGQSNLFIRYGTIVRLAFLLIAAATSGAIYVKIFFVVRRFQRNFIRPIDNRLTQFDIRRKDLRSARHTFIIFTSFFLCRIPLMIAMFIGIVFHNDFSPEYQCFYEELSNLATQIIFLATISDPIVFIRSQSKLREKFFRFYFWKKIYRK